MKFNFKLFKNKLYYKFSKNKYLPFLNSYSEQYIINIFQNQLELLSYKYDLGAVTFEIKYLDYCPEKVFYIESNEDKPFKEVDSYHNKIIDELHSFSKEINLESFYRDLYIFIKY